MKDTIKEILILAICFALGFWLSRFVGRQPTETTIITTVDSTSTVDSKVVEKPKPKDSTVIHHIYVKLPVVQDPADTSQISVPVPQDSALVDIPIEKKVYQEDSLYRAVISGYNCNLDSLTIFNTTTTITVHEKSPTQYMPHSWTLFPEAEVNYGAGALEMKAGIGADISISENRRWRFNPEIGYRVLQLNDQMLKGYYVEAKIKYNLIQVK